MNRFTVPHADNPDEKQMYFVTNRPIDEDSAEALAGSYRQRWGVETSYRVIGDFLPKSRSTVYSVRLFYVLFAATLYNLWVLVNRLLTVVFALSATTVVLSAAVFGRIVQRQWLPTRPETD